MTTLITGATGFLGNNLARQLIEQGERPRVLVRSQSGGRALEALDVELFQGELGDEASLRSAFQGVSTVIHAAGLVDIGWRRARQYRRDNVEGTRNILNAARDCDAKVVFVSSINALGIGSRRRPVDEETAIQDGVVPCPYVTTKRAAEQLAADAARDQHVVIVCPAFMLGPWDWKPSSGRMLLEIARRFVPFAPAGGVSVCDVRDVCRGILAAVDRGRSGERYVLAGQNISYLRLWKLIASAVGKSRSLGPWGVTGPLIPFCAGQLGDLVGRVTGREPAWNSAAVRMSRQYHYFSSAKAESQLDYRTREPAESISDAWQWFREFGYAA